MKRSTLVLLLSLLAIPAIIDAHMIFEAMKVYTGQPIERIQSDLRLAYNSQVQSIGASVISILGLHLCLIFGVKARHPLHIGFVTTTLLTVVILFACRFISSKYAI